MTVNLSDDWCIQKKINITIIVVFLIWGVFLFTQNNFEDIIIGILTSGVPVACMLFIEIKAVNPIIKKINFSVDFIVMTSSKNRCISVDLNKSIYFQVLKTRVGKYKSQKFIILSNNKFEALNQINGLGKICKIIDKDQNKIIVPYNEKTSPWFKLDVWRQIEQ